MRWTIAMLYLTRRWVEPSVAIWIFWRYWVAVVLLEYPTWVIWDKFGHKISATACWIFSAIWMLINSFELSWWWYVIWVTVHAIGMSLWSWSTTAVLKSIVWDDFKNVFPTADAIVTASRAGAAFLWWWLFTLNPLYPVWCTALLALLGALFFSCIKTPSWWWSTWNMLKIAGWWLRYIFWSKLLIWFFLVVTILWWFRYNVKTLVPLIAEYYDVWVQIVTWVVGANFLIRSISALMFTYISKRFYYGGVVLLFLFTSFWVVQMYVYSMLWRFIALVFCIYWIEMDIKISVTDRAPKDILSTVLSTFSLWWRLWWSVLMFIAWYLLQVTSYATMLLIISAGILFILISVWIWWHFFKKR